MSDLPATAHGTAFVTRIAQGGVQVEELESALLQLPSDDSADMTGALIGIAGGHRVSIL